MKFSEKIRDMILQFYTIFAVPVPNSVADPDSHLWKGVSMCKESKASATDLEYHPDEDPHEIRSRNRFKVKFISGTESTSKCKREPDPDPL
jgi:hypothetical protein